MAAGINRSEKDIQECEKIKSENKKLKLECFRI
jgi:hypothetical protein